MSKAQQVKSANKSPNVVPHNATVTRARREQLNAHKSVAIWFTGLSGSGKSTIAHTLEEKLHQHGIRTYVFDGDNVRHGLCSDLGFSAEDRHENIRRISEMVNLFLDAGIISLTAFISPFREDRSRVRHLIGDDEFIEVYCACSLETCEQRDTKGLYKRARAGEIPNFTGVSAPYEAPEHADIVLNTDTESLEESVDKLFRLLVERGIVEVRKGSLISQP